MLEKPIRERSTGLGVACAVLIAGLVSIASPSVEYGDDSVKRTQNQSDASPVSAKVNPGDQRGLILYFLMEATRAQSAH